jgi:hypothetical protein
MNLWPGFRFGPLAKLGTGLVTEAKSGPDWARTSDPALIKRML